MDTSLEDKLLQDIIKGDINAVNRHISQGANPNIITKKGNTCLGEASKMGNMALVKLLLDSCSDNERREVENTSKKSHKRKLKTIDQHSSNVSKCKSRSEQINQQLKQNINNYEIKNEDNLVVSNSVASRSDENKVENTKYLANCFLVTSSNVDLEWDEDIVTVASPTSEDESLSSMYKWYAAILEKTGAAIATALKVTDGINQQDAFMRTALLYATEHEHAEIVKLLIDSGSKIDEPGGDGYNSLHIAVIKNNIEIVNLLLSAGSQIDYETPDAMTSLHFAALNGHLEILKILVKRGACLEIRDIKERTALHMAVRRGHTDVVKYLISCGANINVEEIQGFTPLGEAVRQNIGEIVKILLNAGARVTHSHTLLHSAIKEGKKDVASVLINKGTGINLPDETGDTPLLVAVRFSKIEIVQELLQKKANVNICNNITGASALHIAVESVKNPKQFEQLLLLLLNNKIDMNTIALTGDTALSRALLLYDDPAAALLIRYGADVNTTDNLSIVKERVTNYLAKLLLKAGHYRPIHEQCCILPKKDTTAYWLHNICKEPFSLLDLCRIQIRTHCTHRPLNHSIAVLPIPVSLKRFLMFEDIFK